MYFIVQGEIEESGRSQHIKIDHEIGIVRGKSGRDNITTVRLQGRVFMNTFKEPANIFGIRARRDPVSEVCYPAF